MLSQQQDTINWRACDIILWAMLLLSTFPIQAKTPDQAPEFSLPELNSEKQIKLSDYRGQVVLVDFWASWCGPCRASFPGYNALRNRLQRELGPDQFEILAINVDVTEAEANTFLAKQPVDFKVLRESTGKSSRDYNLVGMPTSFLIDPDGQIIIAHQGYSPAYLELLETEIKRLLNVK
ncbi:MAG: TlpA family protein disulfide reductase [Pseudomonadales bacterium]|nr:TlpA family protein disulfide reductase [Pseudomonadales bacterium]